MKEYIKLYWQHTSEKESDEPVVLLYEVDLLQERYATRMIEIYENGNTENMMDEIMGLVTEAPLPTIEEINSVEYGTEFHACLMTKAEFEMIWHTKKYQGDFDWQTAQIQDQ